MNLHVQVSHLPGRAKNDSWDYQRLEGGRHKKCNKEERKTERLLFSVLFYFCIFWRSHDLLSFSAEAERCLWISGVHFQRSLRGAGSSLTLAALTSLDGLPLLGSQRTMCFSWWQMAADFQPKGSGFESPMSAA